MSDNISDTDFARTLRQMGGATLEQIEAAKQVQADASGKDLPLPLGDVLIQQGIITPAMRENVEKRLQAQAVGGIKQLGPYKLIRKIGEGGMGTVYLAEDLNAGRQVALKVLSKKVADNEEIVSRFRREAKAAGALNHVNIVCAYNTGEDQGFHYLAMEYCEGETLDKTLKRDMYLPCNKALSIVLEVARGLQHAHAQGFIHRDIKPANIMLCKPLGGGPGVAKILDLGLSKDLRGGVQDFATQTGLGMGTPHYISPEAARGVKNIDGRADIYSLGATFYHLITGLTPFEGATAGVVINQHLNEQLINPQDINAKIPDGVAHVIMKMMAKEPEDRYTNCKELIEDLELVINGKYPSSHLLEAAKSSVALRGLAVPRPSGMKSHTKTPLSPLGTRRPVPAGGAGALARKKGAAAQSSETRMTARPGSRWPLYIAAGSGALVVLGLIIGLVVSSASRGRANPEALAAAVKKKADEAARLVDNKLKAVEEEERKLAEERQKLEAAEAEAKKNANITLQNAAAARAAKAQQLFSAVLKETAPLLAQNKFADALALLERKVTEPALADAVELLKQEQADIEAVVALRLQAGEALRKQVGQQVTLKKDGTAFTGKIVSNPQPDVVTLDMGGELMTFNALLLSPEDVDDYAPQTGNGADLRQRGIMYLAAGAGYAAKAKEYFTKPQTPNPKPYLDRITALELGKSETAAVGEWNKAEALFSRKVMKEARDAYDAFTKQYGQTKTAAGKTALLNERYEAIEAVIGPAQEIVLDLDVRVKMETLLVKAGEFDMGSSEGNEDEKPVHKVKIGKPFYLGKYVVTQEQYEAIMGNNPSYFKGAKNPVEGSWNDAQVFCQKLSKKSGKTVRLPTEAEWEYACRAGTSTKYYSGDTEEDLKRIAWYEANSGGTTHPVGQKEPNKFGLYGMAGNVWQWCQDRQGAYPANEIADPQGPAQGSVRVLRGGSWRDGPWGCRSAVRFGYDPSRRDHNVGFRVVVVCGSSKTP